MTTRTRLVSAAGAPSACRAAVGVPAGSAVAAAAAAAAAATVAAAAAAAAAVLRGSLVVLSLSSLLVHRKAVAQHN